MAIPTLITELSTTAAANAPAGSDSPSTLDDIQRAHASFIAQLRDADALKLNASAVSAFGLTLVDDASAAAARTTLGAAASGANTDITSLGAVTGVTATVADNTTKLATTAFVIANAIVPSASETVAGKIEIATSGETNTGVDNSRAVTPLGLSTLLGLVLLGNGQTWQNMAGSRAFGTTYTNSTTRPICVSVTQNSSAACSLFVSGVSVAYTGQVAPVQAIVPAGGTYSVTSASTLAFWAELR